MAVDVDVTIEPDPPQAPLGIFIGLRRQRLQRRAVELEKQIAAADTQAPHRAGIEIANQQADRLVHSASEKKRRLRSRANIQRSTTSTPTSTLALSRGRRGRAGRIAVR